MNFFAIVITSDKEAILNIFKKYFLNRTKPLTHFSSIFHFYTPWQHQKIKDFQTFSRGTEMEHLAKIG